MISSDNLTIRCSLATSNVARCTNKNLLLLTVTIFMFVFIDESGQPDRENIKRGPYVLAACIVPRDVGVNYIENIVNQVRQQYNIPPDVELKGREIINRREFWGKIEIKVCENFLKSLFHELSVHGRRYGYPKFIVVAIKRKWGSSPRKMKILKIGYEALMERVISFIHSISWMYKFRYIICIIDSTGTSQESNIKSIIEDVVLRVQSRYNIPFKDRILVFFRDSKKEICIQLSDIVAYLARYYVLGIAKKDDFNIEIIWNKIWNNLLAGFKDFEVS